MGNVLESFSTEELLEEVAQRNRDRIMLEMANKEREHEERRRNESKREEEGGTIQPRKMRAVSPNGKRILGTLERLEARADIEDGSFFRDESGEMRFEWEGYTEVFWDSQRTLDRKGKVIFLDDDGDEWTAEQLTLEVADDC